MHLIRMYLPTPNLPCTLSVCIYLPRTYHAIDPYVSTYNDLTMHLIRMYLPTPNLPCTLSVCIYLPRTYHALDPYVSTYSELTMHLIRMYLPTPYPFCTCPGTYPCLSCTHPVFTPLYPLCASRYTYHVPTHACPVHTLFTPLYPLCSHPTLRASPSGTFLLEERMS